MSMGIVVIDTETTGLGEEDRVVEMAAVTVAREGFVTSMWSSFVKSDRPVEPEARAAHHISDKEIEAAPHPDMVPVALMLGESAVAAHNIAFDARMIKQTWGHQLNGNQICTYRCARHMWGDLPSYSNQALRYRLKVDVPDADGMPAHRALADALVTAGILQVMMREKTIEELIQLTKEPVLLTRVSMGKYRGKLWSEMDSGYLRWVLDPRREFDEDTRHTAEHWLSSRVVRSGI